MAADILGYSTKEPGLRTKDSHNLSDNRGSLPHYHSYNWLTLVRDSVKTQLNYPPSIDRTESSPLAGILAVSGIAQREASSSIREQLLAKFAYREQPRLWRHG